MQWQTGFSPGAVDFLGGLGRVYFEEVVEVKVLRCEVARALEYFSLIHAGDGMRWDSLCASLHDVDSFMRSDIVGGVEGEGENVLVVRE